MKKKDETEHVDAVFEDYTGKKRFTVEHAAHPPMTVAAPDENSAMVAAAEHAGLRWQSYSYYAYARVWALN